MNSHAWHLMLASALTFVLFAATDQTAQAQLRRPSITPVDTRMSDPGATPDPSALEPVERVDLLVDWVRFDGEALVPFAFDDASHVVVDGVRMPLIELGERLSLPCHISGVVVVGYASSSGGADYNDRLAQHRAQNLLDATRIWYRQTCQRPLSGWRIVINRGESRITPDRAAQRPVSLLTLAAHSSSQGLLTGNELHAWAASSNQAPETIFQALQAGRTHAQAGRVNNYVQCQVIEDTRLHTGQALCDLLLAADREIGIF